MLRGPRTYTGNMDLILWLYLGLMLVVVGVLGIAAAIAMVRNSYHK